MKIRCWRICMLIIVSCFCVCMPIPVKRAVEGGPSVRVGLVENIEKATYSVDGAFKITDEHGNKLAMNLSGGEWEIKIKTRQASRKRYRLLVLSTDDLTKANARREELDYNRYPAEVITIGRKITETTHVPSAQKQPWFDSEKEYQSNGKVIADNRIYRVYLQQSFSKKSEAEKYQGLLKRHVETTVEESYYGDAAGTIEIKSKSGGANYTFDKTIKIVGSMVTLKEFSPKGTERWDVAEARTYRGDMEFRIDDTGKLTVINELPVETYLRGVVSAEMSVSFPPEALKAQAIVARSNVIRKLGIYHQNQHFDVCDDEHCQVYRGIVRESVPTDNAVNETHGVVLTYQGRICDSPYHSTCGGHTENNENIWSGEPQPHLRGILDSKVREKLEKDQKQVTFEDEALLDKWLNASTEIPAYCNMQREDAPLNLKFYADHFRWRVNFSQDAFASVIRKKTGKNLGKIKNIVPMERGVSGRLKKIRIEGTRGDLVIEKELKIRDVLSETRLRSSCFIIERRGIVGEIPTEFIIKGAGFGHGVGMCQVGAGGMAQAKKSYADILRHYYAGAEIKVIY
ncbi:SpoIID/LytB domain-containing protein [candidate division KSB1 bacterium]|nr:SpoIID/LytB domain-containing protein [candidate division KSB1 bacterium]